ncbi:radical SAM protein [bacterium]|nr:radical SAM protein [bacterium]
MNIELPFNMDFIINLTYRCNLRCKMCTQYGKNYKEQAIEEMNIQDWINFLNDIKDVTPKPKLILMGGEPFLYKDFEKLFKIAVSYNLKTHIITNGYYLDKFIPILKDTDTDITISLDGLFNVHDEIRNQKNLFKKVVQNIKLIDEAQKSGSKMRMRINQVILPENVDKVADFYNYFKDYDIDTFTFQHLQSSDEELNNLTQKQWRERLGQDYCMGLIPKEKYNLNAAFANRYINATKDFIKNYSPEKCFSFPALAYEELADYYTNNNLDNLRKNMICTTAWTTPAIEPNGNVSNCIGNIIGNLKENSFWDIWNNDKAQKLRDALITDGKFTICTKCCNFYKGNFIAAPEGKLEINGYKLELPDVLNYIQSSKCVAFIRDTDREQKNEYIPVIPINIHRPQYLDFIKKENEIITIIE